MSYVIYSDESGNGADRFEAVGTISGLNSDIDILRTELNKILLNHSQSHCEYKKIAGVSVKKCALEFVQTMHRFVVSGKIKVMVLVWDKHDTRHSVFGRDDCLNLSIMYYHGLITTMKQWGDVAIDASFHPDELSKVDFKKIVKFINNTRINNYASTASLLGDSFKSMFPVVVNHSEVKSKEEPVTQLIDIMTGIVRLSYEESIKYKTWLISDSGQQDLFGTTPTSVSKNMSYKFELKREINDIFKISKLSIGLSTTNGFHSYKPSCGYFFWKYLPQRATDKAPRRQYI